MAVNLQPPPKRFQQQQYNPGPLGIQMPQPQPQQQRMHYPAEQMAMQQQHHLQNYQQQQQQPSTHSRVPLTLSLPDQTQSHSPSYPLPQPQSYHHNGPVSPSFPTSPYAASPLSPYSTTSHYDSLSPYVPIPHRHNAQTPQQQVLTQLESQLPSGYVSGYSSPYKYLQNRASPYAPVRPARTLPSQFVPPRMQWSMIPPSEELWYQPLGLHGHSGLRRGIPAYNEYGAGGAGYATQGGYTSMAGPSGQQQHHLHSQHQHHHQ